ncbi:hypothetical protein MM440_05290 [Arsenicicoccus piscis]|uniref:Uncharacterized protein n=1 Tax=Arsenicicoccus piscis TaxID=673954 RepID=A0ABQ6HLE8_9MICO|nr:hypothetical protein [Arsenicicoccus piscis]MCH8627213.1 hypothetical protein [Arsenicicoccus piscis]GMA18812.1 hypothetical protein GCM10025862_08330 [Arsenicicoccus piscis]
MTSAALLLAAEESENAMTLPFADFWFGVIALAVFLLLLALTYAFRNTAIRYRQNPQVYGGADGRARHDSDHGATHGAHH